MKQILQNLRTGQIEAVLDMMAEGKIDVKPLITHRFQIEEAEKAYDLLSGKEPYLGVILRYPQIAQISADEGQRTGRAVRLGGENRPAAIDANEAIVGFIGAGNYAGRVLIPAFKKAGAVLQKVASSGGVSAVHFGRKFGFVEATTDSVGVLADETINTVVIATRHNTHARFVCEALRAGKHVFVEKPLCITLNELELIIQAAEERRWKNKKMKEKKSVFIRVHQWLIPS
jgi:hypothetical protein